MVDATKNARLASDVPHSNVRNRHRQSLAGYIYHSRPLIPDGFHLILKRFERRVSQTYPSMLSAKPEPTSFCSRGERSTTDQRYC